MAYATIRICPTCQQRNRIPARHLSDAGRCGACRRVLDPSQEPIDVDASAFDEITRASSVPILVDFWAPWCGPCRAIAPAVTEVAREVAGRAIVLKVNTEQHPDLASRYQITAIPTFAVWKNGRPIVQRAGALPKAQLRRLVEDA